MPKINLNGRDNTTTQRGITDLLKSWIDQSLVTDADPTFNSLEITNNVVIGGDLTVNGDTTIIGTDVLEIRDNIIEINSVEIGPGVTANLSGLQINRGSLTDYQIVFRESDDSVCLGEVGNLQTIATREDNPLADGIAVFNSVLRRFDSRTTIPLSTTFISAESASSSADGALRVQGGFGVTGDQYIDGRIYVKGNNYNNYFDVNSSQETIISSSGNILLTATSPNYVKLPADVGLTFGGNSHNITGDGSNVTWQSSGVINIRPGSGLAVALRANSPLTFGISTERIIYDNTDLVLSATNRFVVNPITSFSNTTASTSNSNGAVRLSGGMSISNTTEAISSSNGGSLTTAGGVAIAKKLFVAGQSLFENTDELSSISSNGGASVAKKMVVGSNYSGNPGSGAIFIQSNGHTFTDTTTANLGVVSNVNFNSFGVNVLSATNNVTSTDVSTVYIQGSPVPGTNQTITNRYSLFVDSGITRLDGDTQIQSTTPSSSINSGALVVDGGVSIKENLNLAKKLDVSSNINSAPSQGVFLSFSQSTVNDNVTVGTAGEMSINYITTPILTASNTITTTNASTFTIENAPTQGSNQTLTNRYAMWIKNGSLKLGDTSTSAFKLDGGIDITNTTDATSSTTGGTIKTAGGVAIAKKLFVGTELTVESTVQSTTPSDGALLVQGGISVVKNSIIGQKLQSGYSDFQGSPSLGVNLTVSNNTFTDNSTSTSGTATEFSSSSFKQPTLSATNASITTTDASTLCIEGAPIQGTNQTITNNHALLVKSGDSKMAGKLRITDSTASSSTSTGALQVSGGVGILGNVNVGQNLDVNGATTLDQTTIDTTEGQLSVSGTNGINMTVGSASNFNTTSGNITIDSQAGSLILDGNNALTLDSTGSVSLDAGASSNFTTTTGTLTLQGPTVDITSTTSATTITGGATGGISLSTSDITNGIKIGTTNSGTPITIGHNSSEVVIGDNLTVAGNFTVAGETTILNSTLITIEDNAIIVNSMPSALSDGGFLVKRYQTPNNAGTGRVVTDTPFETSTFQSGSATPGTLVLNASASAVNDYYKGYWLKINSGSANGRVRRIKSYVALTKTATLYATADNVVDQFIDGLDLDIAPSSGDSYSVYPGAYSGMFHNDTTNEWVIGNVPFDEGAGKFPLNGYHNLHINSLVVEGGISYGGNSTFDGTLTMDVDNTQAILIRKDGTNGDVFYVNTITPSMTGSNPVSTVASEFSTYFSGYNSSSAEVRYSGITSIIEDNSAGAHNGSMSLKVSRNGTLTEYMKFNGNTQIINVPSAVSRMTLSGTTSSTSNSTGVLVLSGGLGISNTTDAVSSTNGGSFTTAGGVAIGKKLFTGDNLNVNSLGVTTTSQAIASFSNNGTGKVQIIDEGTASQPAGISSVQTNGLGLYANQLKVYDSPGSTLRMTIAQTSGDLSLTSTTESSSSITGSITTAGGLGVAKKLFVGTDLSVSGNVTAGVWQGTTITVPYGGTGATTFTSTGVLLGNGSGAITAGTGITYTSSTLTLPKIVANDTTEATSSTVAPVLFQGGLGVAKKAFFGSEIYTLGNIGVGTSTNVNNSLTFSGDSVIGLNTNDTTDNGSITICGGGAISDTRGASIKLNGNEATDGGSIDITAGNNNALGVINLRTASTTRLTVLYSGVTNFPLTTDASSSTVGAVTLAGGLAVAKKIYVGTDLNVNGNSLIGTVTSGTWNGTAITVSYGGTGATTFTANSLLIGNGTSAVSTDANLFYSSSTLTTPKISSTDTSQSTSVSTGAVTLLGGMGIAKNVYTGEGLFVAGNIGIATTTNVNSALTLNGGSNIGVNTLVTADDSFLSISGSGTSNQARGAVITLHGVEHANTGQLRLTAGNVSGGSVLIQTQNTTRITVDYTGNTTLSKNTSSTSSSTGALILSAGGLAIGNTTNAVSSTNGGSFTTAGGAAIAQDLYIGGDLFVNGSIPGATLISSPSAGTYTLVNLASATSSNNKLLAVGVERTFSCVFAATPTTANTLSSFEFDVPGQISNFTTVFDIVASTQGFHDTTNFFSVENLVCHSVVGSTRGRIRFTSGSTSPHYIQLMLKYTV